MGDRKRNDPIPNLISTPFKTLPEAEKKIILEVGRPKPPLSCANSGHDVENGSTITSFEVSWYDKYCWLAGSSTNDRLYCWPCLLLSKYNRKKKVWTRDGFCHFRSFDIAAISHESSNDHIQHVKELEITTPKRQSNTVVPSPSVDRNTVDKVTKNRLLIRRLTEATLILCRMGFACDLLGNDPGGIKFKEFFSLLISHDTLLKAHCDTLGQTYTNIFPSILENILDTVNLEISFFQRDQLNQAPFFSIQVDNTIDFSDEHLHTIIARFVDKNGDLQEHFLGFSFRPNNGQATAGLFGALDAVLGHSVYKSKIISHSFCGLSMNPKVVSVCNKKIKSKSPESIMIHSVAHKHEVMLVQCLSFIPSIRIFFTSIQAMITEFMILKNKDDLPTYMFSDETIAMNKSIACVSLGSEVMGFMLYERDVFIAISEEKLFSKSASKSLILRSDQYLKTLKSTEFVFLLLVFQSVFKVTDDLFGTIQKRSTDIREWSCSVTKAVKRLQQLKNVTYFTKLLFEARILTQSSKSFFSPLLYTVSEDTFVEICLDAIGLTITHIENRYGNLEDLEFLQLVDPKKFPLHETNFPSDAIKSLENTYGKHFNIEQLQEELQLFIYNDKDFYLSPPDVVKQILKANLKIVIPESYKLFCLAATLPITPFKCEDCYQRTITCLQSMKDRGAPTVRNPLAMVMIQDPLLLELEKDITWYEKIVDRFGKNKKKHMIEVVLTK